MAMKERNGRKPYECKKRHSTVEMERFIDIARARKKRKSHLVSSFFMKKGKSKKKITVHKVR